MNSKFSYVLFILVLVTGCAKNRIVEQRFDEQSTIHYSQLENVDDISAHAFYLNEGDKILVNMSLYSDVVELSNDASYLVMKKKAYFRLLLPDGMDLKGLYAAIEQKNNNVLRNIMIYLSTDAVHWAPYTDYKAVKQVFGIEGGSISVGAGIEKGGELQVRLNISTLPTAKH